MIGAEPPAIQRSAAAAGAEALRVRGLNLARHDPFGTDLVEVNLSLRAGEVVGVAGVSGNGQRELLLALSGEDVRAEPPCIEIQGQPAARLGPRERRALGLHVVPEERLGRGAVPSMSLALNLLLTDDSQSWLRPATLKARAQRIIDRFRVKAPGPQATAASLSGGNLQKYIVGREVDAQPRVFIVSQPTWGVDVGASAQIREAILALKEKGCAVLVISEELDELFEMADRLHVMAKGRLSPPLSRAEATVERVGEWMSGLWPSAATVDAAGPGPGSMAQPMSQGGGHAAP